MIRFTGSAQITPGQIKTLSELIEAAIGARALDTEHTAAVRTSNASRFKNANIQEGSIRTEGGQVYVMDRWRNAHIAGDFTAIPGGGVPLSDGSERHLTSGESTGSTVIYNGEAVNVTLYIDVVFS
jgi:hypothetical protein